RFIKVDTGNARFVIRRQGFNLIDGLWLGDRQLIAPGDRQGPYMADEHGTQFWAANDVDSDVVVEDVGPLSAVIRAQGAHVADGRTLGRYVVRMHFHAGLPY